MERTRALHDSLIAAPSVPGARVRVQIWTLLAVIFLVMVGFGVVMPILPFFARQFGASPVQMGLLITGWAGAQFLAAPIWGLLADRIGRKPMLVLGIVGYCLAFVGMAAASSYAMLLAARIVGGLISSSVLPAGQAIAADLTPPTERGAVMGTMGAGFGLGFLVGPALGGVLAVLGARAPFYAAAAASALALPLVLLVVREPARDRPRTEGGGRLGLAPIARALASPERSLYLAAFAATFGGSSLFSMLGYYAIDRAGSAPSTVGLMFTALGLGSVVTQAGVVGPVARRWGEVRGIRVGFLGGALGFAAVACASSATALVLTVGAASVAMALLRPLLAAYNTRVTRLGYGTSMGMQAAFDSLGRTLGPLWAGLVYETSPVAPFVAAAAVYVATALGLGRLDPGAGAARSGPPR